jgi:2-keto-4-pentenoate hydratase
MIDAEAAARLLWAHWTREDGLSALPPGLRPSTRAEGQAICAALPGAAQQAVVGWKIAATSVAGQKHINVSGPIAGRILDGQLINDGSAVSLAGNRMRVVEPEFGFRFGRELPPRDGRPHSVDEVLDAVASLHPIFEVPNSRFADFARAGEAQLQADNACSGRFLIGAAAACDWRALDLATHRVEARVSGASGTRYERGGDGSAVLGDPRVALAWLVNEVRGLGLALHAGDLVSTGTCMAPLEVRPGDRVRADYGPLGMLSIELAD